MLVLITRDLPSSIREIPSISSRSGKTLPSRNRLQKLNHTPPDSPGEKILRAVAVAEVRGPDVALELLEDLDLDRYQRYHAIRADLLRRLDRAIEAKDAYRVAIALTDNPSERRFLQRRFRALSS